MLVFAENPENIGGWQVLSPPRQHCSPMDGIKFMANYFGDLRHESRKEGKGCKERKASSRAPTRGT